MKVFKFGGASIRDAAAVCNAGEIIETFPKVNLVVVVSAMGKMTNALEAVVAAYREAKPTLPKLVDDFYLFHTEIVTNLDLPNTILKEKLSTLIGELRQQLERPPSDNPDFDYDQVVSFGELFSSIILSEYLQSKGINNVWEDARVLVRTDTTYREGKVNWDKSVDLITAAWEKMEVSENQNRRLMITQGFIGHTAERNTTTLGREGSDFTAAIFAFALNAEAVIIWKDVPGVLNADPKYFKDAVMLKRISYKEAIELAYYGASVLHPKTIKPLQNKKISLFVQSFKEPQSDGTQIDSSTYSDSLVPSFIFKVNQVLISFTPRDFSFVVEENLKELFGIFLEVGVKIHLMQNSAINFSICVDYEVNKVDAIREACRLKYEVLYNTPCELVTIRHYDRETIGRLLIGKEVLVEQRSRSTARFVLKV